ncbi:RsmB/NOP family class I SAM-dependent RNA methyltransferase [Stella sp.]|uniref:RsmB/NOP family class I SAM-dependent RNA methyltransferase n=1 Tax=Stella sp. TaxID=2912054 RepID=UPI0035B4A000
MGLTSRAAGRPTAPPKPPPAAGLPARRAAAAILFAVLEQRRPLDEALAEWRDDTLAGRDRAFARRLVATALRRLGEIDAVLAGHLAQPLERAHPRARSALRLGVAQIVHLGTPAHAAVSATVATLDGHGTERLKGLVNAVLRKVAAAGHAPREGVAAARKNTPQWLWTTWERAYGADGAAAIAAAHLADPPLDLTVPDDADGWAARIGGLVRPTGTVRVVDAGPVAELPGYAEGAWWVQDAAAALPVRLLGDVAARSVLDLCAAPGGKAAQLAAAGARVTAVDLSPRRSRTLAANLERLALAVEIVTADAVAWRPEEPADAVLVDAPCSATGTIRRHPDILHLRHPEEIDRLLPLQDRLLAAAVEMVKPGGRIVFATCSLQPEEGMARIRALLESGAPVVLDPVRPEELPGLPEAAAADGTLRTLPSFWPEAGGMDGFFAARLRRLPVG